MTKPFNSKKSPRSAHQETGSSVRFVKSGLGVDTRANGAQRDARRKIIAMQFKIKTTNFFEKPFKSNLNIP